LSGNEFHGGSVIAGLSLWRDQLCDLPAERSLIVSKGDVKTVVMKIECQVLCSKETQERSKKEKESVGPVAIVSQWMLDPGMACGVLFGETC